MRLSRALCATTIAAVMCGAAAQPAMAVDHSFGAATVRNPLLAVQAAATTAYAEAVARTPSCATRSPASTRLTPTKLAAIALAVTWYEATGGDVTSTPSPMTNSRSDTESELYGPQPRTFWHPGIGMWQMDDVGVLGNGSARGKFNGAFAAGVITRNMAGLFCRNRGRLAVVYAAYNACDSGRCASTFGQIYTSDRLRRIVGDRTVNTTGGTDAFRRCRIRTPGGSQVVGCSYVNFNRAQGNTSWLAPGYGPSPVPLTYYVITQQISGQFYELRVWIPADTPYPSTVSARRRFGQDSRTGLLWRTTLRMCDLTTNRGDC